MPDPGICDRRYFRNVSSTIFGSDSSTEIISKTTGIFLSPEPHKRYGVGKIPYLLYLCSLFNCFFWKNPYKIYGDGFEPLRNQVSCLKFPNIAIDSIILIEFRLIVTE